jgi:hypothetical protein
MAADAKTQVQSPGRRAASMDWTAAHIATIAKVLLVVILLAFPLVYRAV